MLPKVQGLVAIFLAAVLWSTTGVLARYASVSVDPLVTVAIKTALGAAILAGIGRKVIFRIKPSDFKALALPGIAYGTTAYFFVLAVANTTIANTYFLYYSEPIFVAILAFLFFRKLLSRNLAAALAMVIAGLFLLFSPSSSAGTLIGNIYALAGGLTYAIYIIACERAGPNRASRTITFWSFLFGFLFVGAMILVLRVSATASTIKAAFPFILLYALIDTIAYLLLNKGLKTVDASVAGTVLASEPILAVGLGYLFFGETLSVAAGLGAALILTGVINAGRKSGN